MTEAWHAEQLTAISPAPDLLNPHEPSRACGDTHCYSHGTDEAAEGGWRVCFECKHVYRTAEELQREWAANAPPDIRGRPAPPVEQIYFCPLCMHDW